MARACHGHWHEESDEEFGTITVLMKRTPRVPAPEPAADAPALVTQAVAEERLRLVSGKLATFSNSLPGWRLVVDHARTRAGVCNYTRKTIAISKHYLWDAKTMREELLNTVLHEIAHALVGVGKGHGPEWKQVALSIGCDALVCLPRAVSPCPHLVTCPCGKVQLKRHRVSEALLDKVCKACKGALRRKAPV